MRLASLSINAALSTTWFEKYRMIIRSQYTSILNVSRSLSCPCFCYTISIGLCSMIVDKNLNAKVALFSLNLIIGRIDSRVHI